LACLRAHCLAALRRHLCLSLLLRMCSSSPLYKGVSLARAAQAWETLPPGPSSYTVGGIFSTAGTAAAFTPVSAAINGGQCTLVVS